MMFPKPTKESLSRLTADSCRGIAYQIQINTTSDDDYGNLARECAILILNELAESMSDSETLADFLRRNSSPMGNPVLMKTK